MMKMFTTMQFIQLKLLIRETNRTLCHNFPTNLADEKDPFKGLYEALGTAYMQMDITMDLKSKYEEQGLYVALGKVRDALVKLHVLACAVQLKDDDGIELKIATVIVDYIEEYEAFMDFMEGRRDTVTVAKNRLLG